MTSSSGDVIHGKAVSAGSGFDSAGRVDLRRDESSGEQTFRGTCKHECFTPPYMSFSEALMQEFLAWAHGSGGQLFQGYGGFTMLG